MSSYQHYQRIFQETSNSALNSQQYLLLPLNLIINSQPHISGTPSNDDALILRSQQYLLLVQNLMINPQPQISGAPSNDDALILRSAAIDGSNLNSK